MCGGGTTGREKKKQIVAIDFFCGAGGVTKGLSQAGINVIAGIDIDPEFKLTYETNNSPSAFIEKDIRGVTADEIQTLLEPYRDDSFILFAGCAPCQPFSSHYNGESDGRSDRRKYALKIFGQLVDEVEPDFIFSENVPGIEEKYNGKIMNSFISTISKKYYPPAKEIIDAKSYGVPQTRKRLIIMASRFGPIELPQKTHGPGLIDYVTVRDVIEKYPRIKAGSTHESIPNHKTPALSKLNLRRIKTTLKNGGGRNDWPKDLRLKCHKKKGCGHSDVYGRMKWDAPAPTLTCRCYSLSNGRFGHPTQARAISFREAATLQTFPEDYVFYGKSNFSIGTQIGNAVPVMLAQVIGEKFMSHCNLK